MALTCAYCSGTLDERAVKCQNCGAPVGQESSQAKDFRACPYCRRRLLALASPACNYCGRRLPEDYIKAREADLHRITEIREGEAKSEANKTAEELIRQSVRRSRGESSLLDLIDLTDLLS